MYGGAASQTRGMMSRAVEALFEGIERRASTGDFALSCTYLQLYNEVCTDCLWTGPHRDGGVVGGGPPALRLREDGASRVHVEGLRRVPIRNLEEAKQVLAAGAAARTVGATSTNATSSRSHTVFTLSVHAELRGEDGLTRERLTYLHLVDLAGSERQKATCATGVRRAAVAGGAVGGARACARVAHGHTRCMGTRGAWAHASLPVG